MNITDITIVRSSLPLKTPFGTALRRVDNLVELVVVVHTDGDIKGYGAAPDIKRVVGHSLEQIEHELLEIIVPALVNTPIDDTKEVLKRLASLPVCQTTRACIDIALFDIFAKCEEKPLFAYLNKKALPKPFKTLYTISVDTPDTMLAQAHEAYLKGFHLQKIKLDSDNDANIQRLFAIATHLPHVKLFIDANQALSVEDTLHLMKECQALPIVLIEQPVKADDITGMRTLTQANIFDIIADESVFSLEDAVRVIDAGACHGINVKLMKCGGIAQAQDIITYAQEKGIDIMIGSMLESSITVSAALHVALSFKQVKYVDLDAAALSVRNPYDEGGIQYQGCDVTLKEELHGTGVIF